MIIPYLQFYDNCEEAFNFYADVFEGSVISLVRLHNKPENPVMHATIKIPGLEGYLSGADTMEKLHTPRMAALIVIPSKEKIEKIISKLSIGGKITQEFVSHPPPDDKDGGAEVLDKYGFTWYFST